MEILSDIEPRGPFEARYVAFLETITHLRPSLHRYCSRMTGSVLDGEDVVQERSSRHIEISTRSTKAVRWPLGCSALPIIDASISCVAARFGLGRRKPQRSKTLWHPSI